MVDDAPLDLDRLIGGDLLARDGATRIRQMVRKKYRLDTGCDRLYVDRSLVGKSHIDHRRLYCRAILGLAI